MKSSIIIPVYNEAATIAELLRRVERVPIEKEIIVVDDGSTDVTPSVLRTYVPDGIKVIHHAVNRGKGAAIRTALQYVTGDVVIIQDADLEYDPSAYPALVAPLLAGSADVVFGSRVMGGHRGYFTYYWGGRLLSLVGNVLFGTRVSDLPTCYKVMRTSLLRSLNLRCNGFAFCAEVFAQVAINNYRIAEVPITYQPRTFAEGKKIRMHTAFELLGVLLRYKQSQLRAALDVSPGWDAQESESKS